MNNNKTTNILLGILIVVLIAIGIIMAVNQNKNSYRNEYDENKVSMMDPRNEIPDQVRSNTNKQVTTIQDTIKPVVKTPISQTDNLISPNLKTYTNSKYGFSFQYPSSWGQNGDLVEVQDLQGNITNVVINFKDAVTNSHLLISYNRTKGDIIYQSLVSDYNSLQGWYPENGKKISVAGANALRSDLISDKNGKGYIIQPLRKIIVDFLGKKQTDLFELQFSTNAPGDSEVLKFEQLLSSFKMI